MLVRSPEGLLAPVRRCTQKYGAKELASDRRHTPPAPVLVPACHPAGRPSRSSGRRPIAGTLRRTPSKSAMLAFQTHRTITDPAHGRTSSCGVGKHIGGGRATPPPSSRQQTSAPASALAAPATATLPTAEPPPPARHCTSTRRSTGRRTTRTTRSSAVHDAHRERLDSTTRRTGTDPQAALLTAPTTGYALHQAPSCPDRDARSRPRSSPQHLPAGPDPLGAELTRCW